MTSGGSATKPLLPIEIQYEIIEHLWNNHLALSYCALTCKLWLSQARPLLFRKIRRELFDSDGYLDCLAQFLHEHPTIAAMIHEFGIWHLRNYMVAILADELSLVVKRLPNLRRLAVDEFKLVSTLQWGKEDFPVGTEGAALFQTISQCPHLRTMEFRVSMRSEQSYDQSMFTLGSFSRLETLKIYVENSPSLVGALLDTVARNQRDANVFREPKLRQLKRLSLNFDMLDDPAFVYYGSFFEAAGGLLEDLELILEEEYTSYGAGTRTTACKSIDSLRIASCTNLSSLRFALQVPDDSDSWQWNIALATLAAIPSEWFPPHITIDFTSSHFLHSETPPHPLAELDRILDSAPRTKRVTVLLPQWIRVNRVVDHQSYCTGVSTQLPNLVSKGFLLIQ